MSKQKFDEILNDIKENYLPKYLGKTIKTIVQGVENEVLEMNHDHVLFLSSRSRTGKPRKVYYKDFYKIWQKEIENIPEVEIGRINHGRIIQAVFNLHPNIGYDINTQTIRLR